jgi:hypothetical protein
VSSALLSVTVVKAKSPAVLQTLYLFAYEDWIQRQETRFRAVVTRLSKLVDMQMTDHHSLRACDYEISPTETTHITQSLENALLKAEG